MVYNVAESAIMITAGLLADLVSLVGFGVDSGVESMTTILVGLRLVPRLRDSEPDEDKESHALKVVTITLFILAAYVMVEGVRSLVRSEQPDNSTIGLVLLGASVIAMPARGGQAQGW